MSTTTLTSEQLQTYLSTVLDKHKALDITVLPVQTITTLTDYMLICTASSHRHSQALANEVLKAAKAQTIQPLGVEGAREREWILIDLTDVIVHIMLAPIRAFYSLEKLWGYQ